MIAVTPHAEGCLLAVRAQPNAKKAGVVGEQAGALKERRGAFAVRGTPGLTSGARLLEALATAEVLDGKWVAANRSHRQSSGLTSFAREETVHCVGT